MVSIARKAISTFVTGLPRPVAAAFSAAAGASVGAGSGRNSTRPRAPPRPIAREHRGQQAQDRAGTFRRRRHLAGAQAGRRAEQQRAGQAAADRGLRQRHVGGTETHPDEREQQPVGDEADDRGEGLARGDRPDGDANTTHRQADLERQRGGHGCGPSRRAALAMSWTTSPRPAARAARRQTSFSAPSSPSACGNKPEHHEAEAEIVGLGQRVQARQRIGKAQQADRAGEKEEGAGRDRDDRQDVERDAHPPSVVSGASRSQREAPSSRRRSRRKRRAAPERSATSNRGHPGHRCPQQQCRNAAGADQLRRHHAVGVRRPAQDSDQAQCHHRQHEAGSRDHELSHRLPSPQRSRQQFLLHGQLRHHRLIDIEAVNDECAVSSSPDGSVPGTKLVLGEERSLRAARREVRPIDHEPRPQRQPRIKCAPCDIYPRCNGLTQKPEHRTEPAQRGAGSTAPTATGAGLPRLPARLPPRPPQDQQDRSRKVSARTRKSLHLLQAKRAAHGGQDRGRYSWSAPMGRASRKFSPRR